MKSIIFNQAVKHGRIQFIPGVAVAFEDADAVPYFVAAGWAEASDEEPKHTYPLGEVDVDPLTRSAETGQFVQPDVAEAHLAEHDGNPPPPAHEAKFKPGVIAPAAEG